MSASRDTTPAFVALGSNAADARGALERGLAGLVEGGDEVAAVSQPVLAPYETAPGRPTDAVAPVLDVVVRVATRRSAEDLLARLGELEDAAGRVRDGRGERTLDADLLAYGDRIADGTPTLPHPRALARAFVLAPWSELDPLYPVPGTGARVVEHELSLKARHPERFAALSFEARLALPARGARPLLLRYRAAREAWRRNVRGPVGVVPTMGALHEGHASLLRRARAECEAVAATIFVNPMQFGPAEDLERYPRTLEADLDVLARAGADAVYLPAVPEVYPPGFATRVVPEGPAEGLEGNRRPGHFAGVATVVLKLWLAMRPDRIYFGRKDAQQVAVVRRMARDLDLPGRIVVGPTVRDPDGLALSSRNRYLTPPEREQALALPRALEALVLEAWTTPDDAEAPVARARSEMEACGLDVDYVALVDPDTMRPAAASGDPELAVAAARIGRTRLLDNRWVIRRPAGGAP